MSANEINKKTDCMVMLTKDHKEQDWKDLISLIRLPSGMPIKVEGGSHVCYPFEPQVVREVKDRGAKLMQQTMSFCGLRLEALELSEGKIVMQSFWEKALEKSALARQVFQQADAAKQMCP